MIKFEQHKRNKKLYWAYVDDQDDMYISFDKKKIYSLHRDFPTFTAEQIEIIRQEEPFWYNFFRPYIEKKGLWKGEQDTLDIYYDEEE